MGNTKKVISLASGIALLIIFVAPARSEVDSLEVLTSTPIKIGGKNYVEVSAMMNGAVEGRPYRVPISVLHPKNQNNCNGTGIVDIVNTTGPLGSYVDFCQIAGPCQPQAPLLLPPVAGGRAWIGDDFLAQKGYLYLAVQMDKTAIDLVNDPNSPAQVPLPWPGVALIPPGSFIGDATDGYHIIADGAALIKNLSAYLPSSCSAEQTIAFSYSRSGLLLRKIYSDPNIVKPNFDGSILGDIGGYCYSLTGNPFLPPPFLQPSPAPAAFPPAFEEECPVVFQSGSGKVMLVGSEFGNQSLFGTNARDETGEISDYRVYEIAGSSHVPKALVDVSSFGIPRQNPTNTAPVFRAMLENLRAWITDGVEPPPSALLSGPIGAHPFPNFASQPLYDLVFPKAMQSVVDFNRDGDGNALGGIRLPHLATTVKHFSIGAPLGTFNGTEENVSIPALGDGFLPNYAFVVASAGTFDPFDSKTTTQRYPNHGSYVLQVAAAAQYAYQRRWILEEDRNDYIVRAAHCQVGKKKTLTVAELNYCVGVDPQP